MLLYDGGTMLSNPFLFWMLRWLPAGLASWLGGWLSVHVARRRMKLRDARARANLAILRPDLSQPEREAMLTRRWINVGRTLAELANIDRLVGGAGEETIIARVGEGVVTTIGSAETHKKVLENPDSISKTVLGKGLDSGTAFEILSVDIADVDVGDNIGAKLQTEQADADLKIAQAKAEERRAMAQAREQEMTALTEEMSARVKEAEAEVPKAIAEAFRGGNLGIMDYYRMRNIQSDTDMRQSISDSDESTES